MTSPSIAAAALDDPFAAAGPIRRLEDNVGRVLRGKPEVIRLAVVSLRRRRPRADRGRPRRRQDHARARAGALARARPSSASSSPATCLPSDILGVSIFNQQSQQFEFVPGPLFANVVLADEINRATPKTQSALLEAMSEGQVSVERKRFLLPEPFLVLATQNPLEYQGTFPLPESQLDRFLMSLQLGYPPPDEERELLLSGGVQGDPRGAAAGARPRRAARRCSRRRRRWWCRPSSPTTCSTSPRRRARASDFLLGVSTRGAQGLYRAAQALALCEGRGFAVPDDVQRLARAGARPPRRAAPRRRRRRRRHARGSRTRRRQPSSTTVRHPTPVPPSPCPSEAGAPTASPAQGSVGGLGAAARADGRSRRASAPPASASATSSAACSSASPPPTPATTRSTWCWR